MKLPSTLLALATTALAGPYPGAAGTTGSDAIPKDDPRIVAWAAGHSEVLYGSDVDATWRTPEKAAGPAVDDPLDIVCLGNGGRITLFFPRAIADGEGPDFAVFENAIGNTFLELAFVEVSSDGTHFHRFPSDSLTAGPVGAFGSVDPTNLSGLASKHRAGFGTPFDLGDLPAGPTLDKQHVVFVRLVDIIGDGATTDTGGDPIYDPTPTIGSGGFDLDAIAVLNQNDGHFAITRHGFDGEDYFLEWPSSPGGSYRIEAGSDPASLQPVATINGDPLLGATRWTTPTPDAPRHFWRVSRVIP